MGFSSGENSKTYGRVAENEKERKKDVKQGDLSNLRLFINNQVLRNLHHLKGAGFAENHSFVQEFSAGSVGEKKS